MAGHQVGVISPFQIARWREEFAEFAFYGQRMPTPGDTRGIEFDRLLLIQIPANIFPNPTGEVPMGSVIRNKENEQIMSLFLTMLKITQPFCPMIWEPVVDNTSLPGQAPSYRYYRAFFPLTKDHFVGFTRGWVNHWKDAREKLAVPADRTAAKRTNTVTYDASLCKDHMHSNAMYSPDTTRAAYNTLLHGKVFLRRGIDTEIPANHAHVEDSEMYDEDGDGSNGADNVGADGPMTPGPSNSIIDMFDYMIVASNPVTQLQMASVHPSQADLSKYTETGNFQLPDAVHALLGDCSTVRVEMNAHNLMCPATGNIVAENILTHFLPHCLPSTDTILNHIIDIHVRSGTQPPGNLRTSTRHDLFKMFRGNGTAAADDVRYLDPALSIMLKEPNPIFADCDQQNLDGSTKNMLYPILAYMQVTNLNRQADICAWVCPKVRQAISDGVPREQIQLLRDAEYSAREQAMMADLTRIARQANVVLRCSMLGFPIMYAHGYRAYNDSCNKLTQRRGRRSPVMDMFLLRNARSRQPLDWFSMQMVQVADIAANGLNLASSQMPLFVKAHIFSRGNYYNYFGPIQFLLSVGFAGAGKSRVGEVLAGTVFLVRRQDVMSRQAMQFYPYGGWTRVQDEFSLADARQRNEFQQMTSSGRTTSVRAGFNAANQFESRSFEVCNDHRGTLFATGNRVEINGRSSTESTKPIFDRATTDRQVQIQPKGNIRAAGAVITSRDVRSRVLNAKSSEKGRNSAHVLRHINGMHVWDVVEAVGGIGVHPRMLAELMIAIFDTIGVPMVRTRAIGTIIQTAETLHRGAGYHMWEMLSIGHEIGARAVSAKMIMFFRHTCVVTGWRALLASYFLITAGGTFNQVVEHILLELSQNIVWGDSGDPETHLSGPSSAPTRYYATSISMNTMDSYMRTRFADACGTGLVEEAIHRLKKMRSNPDKHAYIIPIPGNSACKECKGNIAVLADVFNIVMTPDEARDAGPDNVSVRYTSSELALMAVFVSMQDDDKNRVVPAVHDMSDRRCMLRSYTEDGFVVRAPYMDALRTRSITSGSTYHTRVTAEQFAKATYFLAQKKSVDGRSMYTPLCANVHYAMQTGYRDGDGNWVPYSSSEPGTQMCTRVAAGEGGASAPEYKKRVMQPSGAVVNDLLFSTYKEFVADARKTPTLSPVQQDAINMFASICAGRWLKDGAPIFVGINPRADINTPSSLIHYYTAPKSVDTIVTTNPVFDTKSSVEYRYCSNDHCTGVCVQCSRDDEAAAGDPDSDIFKLCGISVNKTQVTWKVKDGDLYEDLVKHVFTRSSGLKPVPELLPHTLEMANLDSDAMRDKFL